MPLKAIVIDDDTMCLSVAEEFFIEKDFEVAAHTRAICPMIEQRLETCPYEKPHYDIILSDNNMPSMTGIEFFEYINERGCKISNNNKALLTGDINEEIDNRAKKLGIRVFHKPCPIEKIENWLVDIWGEN